MKPGSSRPGNANVPKYFWLNSQVKHLDDVNLLNNKGVPAVAARRVTYNGRII